MQRTYSILISIVGIILVIAVILNRNVVPDEPFAPQDTAQTEVNAEQSAQPETVLTQEYEVVAESLIVPWDFVFLPDESILITQRDGTIVHRYPDSTTNTISVPGVHSRGEGGLLGIALHPLFNENTLLYLYITHENEDGSTVNRVTRFTYTDTVLHEPMHIVTGIPGARFHNGGRIRFGPDGYLYITTGDSTKPSLSQDTASLAGKILRVTADGDPAPGNPFSTQIYSYGHRNPQGLAWSLNGDLWSTEHGRSGIRSGLDELNRITPGVNYGWPVAQGSSHAPFAEPILHSGDATWAPGGLVVIAERLVFGGLRGEALYEVSLDSTPPTITTHFHQQFGRIRTTKISPDGRSLYFTTSNRDGRGVAHPTDDRLIRIPLNI